MAKAATAIITAGSTVAAVSAVNAWMSPEQALGFASWLSKEIGVVGFVLIVSLGSALGISVVGNLLMWKRLKEKDQECRQELEAQRLAWKAVVEKMEACNKEIGETVAEMLTQMTLLAERARVAALQTRSR